MFRKLANDAGFPTVREWFGEVSKMIQEYVAKGGFMLLYVFSYGQS